MSISLVSGASSDVLSVDATSKAARVTLYDSVGREVSDQVKPTYVAAGAFTPAATPNALVIIYGSATKTVRMISLRLGTTNTAAGSQQYFVHKKSALPTGGVFGAATMIPLDSGNDPATATNVGHYTTDPTAGASLGSINVVRFASAAAIPATWAGVIHVASFELLPTDGRGLVQPVVLRGIAQGVGINFNDVALVAGQTHVYNILWTEE